MAKKQPDSALETPATETAAPAVPPQGENSASAAPQTQEGECQVVAQGEDHDLFFVRYTWAGVEHAHNVRRSSLQRKIEEDRQALQVAQGEERQRVEGLLQRHEYLLSRLPAE